MAMRGIATEVNCGVSSGNCVVEVLMCVVMELNCCVSSRNSIIEVLWK